MEDKFKVSIIADSPCTLITWSRQSLDYLLVKETFLAHILTLILAKDVADKLYAMNEKVNLLRLDGALSGITLIFDCRRLSPNKDLTSTFVSQP